MTVVAIDGPAASGKSTVARAVAKALGYRYLDTGAMYRAVALAGLERDVPLDDSEAMGRLAHSLALEFDGDRLLLDGRDVSQRIRETDVTAAVSQVAAVPAVRSAMVAVQRGVVAGADVVIEGRDIGTAVAPDAEVKIFLTASLEERTRRRARQLGLPEDEATLEELSDALSKRDKADAGRAASPFTRADDAVVVDSTNKGIAEVVEEIAAAVGERG